ncbi:MAG: peroxidase family protein [Pseudomonadota bacterium]
MPTPTRSSPPCSWPASVAVLLSLGALTACNDADVTTAIAEDEATLNAVPVVTLSVPDAVQEGDEVTLSAIVSDVDDTPTFKWEQLGGPTITFSADDVESPTFVAPRIRDDALIVLRFTADDGVNVVQSDEVVITVLNVANGPAGPSPQGIPDDGDARRDEARGGRDGGPRSSEDREVRTYDGTENNLDEPTWGAAFVHLQRLAPAAYGDGISTLAGAARPSPRVISNLVHDQEEGESIPNEAGTSDFLWQWGQFIDHDLDLTDGAEEAADIPVPLGDPYFDPDGSGDVVIAFSRALFDPDTGSSIADPREQENEITSWIDGSMVYGSSDSRAAALREGDDSPYLATSEGDLLPFNEGELSNANGFVTDATTLFLAGDVRANEQVGLAAMHTLFVREHNRIAAVLLEDRPERDPEAVFQQARRMVIAQLQHITYEEWLPALLGDDSLAAYEGYDDSIDPTIFNEFSVAAFRLGHSMLNEQLLRLDAEGEVYADGPVALASAFFTAPALITDDDDLSALLRGLAAQAHQRIDTKVVSSVRNFLFGAPGDGGLDLVSLNIQRGRDHGVPSYNAMREALGLVPLVSIGEITDDLTVANEILQAYGDVDDIDLWVGALAEDKVEGSQLGEVMHTILVRQFEALRDGDRFWYERHLTRDELARVRGRTLAEVIRDNTGVGPELDDDVFRVAE